MEAEKSVRLVNSEGLHARPCHAIVSLALEYRSELRIGVGDHEVSGKSILELMTLNAPCDTILRLRAEGEDADGLLAALTDLVEAGFDESE